MAPLKGKKKKKGIPGWERSGLEGELIGSWFRKLRETVQYLCSHSMVGFYFDKICNSLWPNGQSLTFKPARTTDEKQQTREAANRKLSEWLPGKDADGVWGSQMECGVHSGLTPVSLYG